MRLLFRSKFRITQEFGVNPDYYKKFGLLAHEGIDLVPTGSVWDVLALEDGVVVKDQDDPIQGKAYGNYLTIWHNKINKATQYCHLKENYVNLGDIVKAGDKIGLMGATGNVTGAHVHLNLFQTDDNGIRLNKDNGYLGGIDPLPFLNEEINSVPSDPANSTIISQSDAFIAIVTKLDVPADKDRALAAIEELIEVEKDYENKIKEIEIKNEQLQQVQERATELEGSINTLSTEINALKSNYTASQEALDAALLQVEQLKRDKIDLQDQLNKVRPNPDMSAREVFVLFLKKIGLLK